jgi:hypothetical protein
LQQLLYSPWGYGISVEGPHDEMSFSLGWGHLALVVVACALAVRIGDPETRRWLRFFTAATAVLCFLMLRDAEWIWDGLPLLQYVEFPWRILGPVAISIALLVASLARLLDAVPRWRTFGFALAMALLIVPNLGHLAPRGWRNVDPSSWTASAIASRGIEVTTAGEYVPRWVSLSTPYSPHVGAVVDGEAEVLQTGRTPVSWSAQVAARRASAIQLAIAYFPGWEVRVDGMSAEAKPAAGTGRIRFGVPPGEHHVEARWSPGGAVWFGDGITLASLAALALIWRRSQQAAEHTNTAGEVSLIPSPKPRQTSAANPK